MVKVHITLSEAVRVDPAALERTRREAIRLGLADINEKRFQRYGILTGEVATGVIEQIARLAGVEAVEKDEQKSAL